jgi:hypothetical protein
MTKSQPALRQRVNGVVTRAIDTSIDSIDVEKRTLTVSFSSEQEVTRDSWWDEAWIEVLGHNANEVDLTRLNATAPVLYNHNRYDSALRIGVVERAWLDGQRGYAQLRISQRDEVAGFWQDIQDGILTNISVGYSIDERTLIQKNRDKPDEYRVTRWTPAEISFVDIPADITVGVGRNFQIINLTKEVVRMDPENQPNNEPAPAPVAPAPADSDALRAAAKIEFQQAETARREQIRSQLQPFAQHHPDVVQRCLDDMTITPEMAGQLMLKEMGRGLHPVTVTLNHAEITRDEKQSQREGMSELLLSRALPAKFKMTDNAQRYVGMSLIDMAKRSIGGNLDGIPKHEIVQRALTNSDFSSVLANLANKSLRAAYEVLPRTYLPLANITSVPDFKTITRTQLSGTPALEEVLENGEYKYGAVTDAKEQYQVKTYGKILQFSRQAIINDDLGAFTRLIQQFAASAAQLESDLAWGQILSNPAMGDGTTLFHANHKNLDTAAAITVASLGTGRALLRKQTGLEGMVLNLSPSYLIVPASLETVAQQYVANTQIMFTKGSDFNPFAGTLTVIAEPRLDAVSALSWYLAANPSLIDIIELAYLEGTNGLYTEEQFGFETDGYEIKARLDVGAKVLDWRGLVKNPGA